MAANAADSEDDFTKLPLADKLEHKSWKARMSGYEDVAKLFRTLPAADDPEYSKYLGLLKKFATDANAAAQDAGLVAVNTFVQYADVASRTRGQIVPALVEKGLSSPRAPTKAKAAEGIMLYLELDNPDAVVEDLMSTGFSAKQPKLVAASVGVLADAVKAFGTQVISPKQILKKLPQLFGHADQGVRTEASRLTVELYRWMGSVINQFLEGELKPVQIKELQDQFAQQPNEKARQIRFTRTQQKAMATASATPSEETAGDDASTEDEGASAGPAEVDPYTLSDPVEVLSKVPDNLEEQLESKKWSDRKEALEALHAVIGKPRLVTGEYGALVRLLKKCFGDSNILVVIHAAVCVEDLAKGLREDFQPYYGTVINPMLEKFKEKKKNVVDALQAAIDAILVYIPLATSIGDLVASIAHKNPAVKKETLLCVVRFLCKTKNLPGKTETKTLADSCIKALDDSDAEVRESAAEALGTLCKLNGERAYTAFVDGLDKLKQDKVKTFYDSATVAFKVTAMPKPKTETVRAPLSKSVAPAVAAVPTAAIAPPKAKTTSINKSSVPAPAATAAKANPPVTKTNTPAPAVSTASTSKQSAAAVPVAPAPSTAKDGEPAALLLTLDQKAKEMRQRKEEKTLRWTFDAPRAEFVGMLQEQMEGNIDPEIKAGLFAVDFKKYLASLSILDEAIVKAQGDMPQRIIANLDLLLKYMTIRFFDTNTTVTLKLFDVLEHLIHLMERENTYLSDYEASVLLPIFIIKAGDNKEPIRARVREIMRQLCSVFPASKMFTYILDGVKSTNARTRTECMQELGLLIQRQGIAVCVPNKVLPLIGKQISDKDANVRAAALSVIAQAYSLMGEAVHKLVGDLPAKEKAMLDEKLKRVTVVVNAPTPTPAPPVQGLAKPAALDTATVTSASAVRPSESDRPAAEDSEYSTRVLPGEFKLELDKLGLPEAINIPALPPAVLAPMPTNTAFVSETPAYPLRTRTHFPASKSGTTVSERSQSSQVYVSDPTVSSVLQRFQRKEAQPCVDACKELKVFCEKRPEILVANVDAITETLTQQIHYWASMVMTSDVAKSTSIKLCEQIVNVLYKLFSLPMFAVAISRQTLKGLLDELLHRLLDEPLAKADDSSQLVKALNIVVMKMLDNTNRNDSLHVLLEMLQESCARLVEFTSQSDVSEVKFTDLVMKCIWKTAKVLGESIKHGQLDEDDLLLDIHEFFVATPPPEWKKRAANNVPLGESPLRTIKMILNELVVSLGPTVYHHLGKITEPDRSYVKSYLKLMIETAQKNGSLPAGSVATATGGGGTMPSTPTSSSMGPIADRPPARPVPTTSVPSRPGDDVTDAYRERLNRLKEMLNKQTSTGPDANAMPLLSTPKSPSTPAVTMQPFGDPALTPTSVALASSAPAAPVPASDSPSKPKASAADLAALKERLERLKVKNATTTSVAMDP